jgi:O-antigen ligase
MARVVFGGLLALIATVPWPLAADRPLPGSVVALWVGVLLALWAVFGARRRHGGARAADRYLLPVVLLFAVTMIWLAIQTAAPLPSSLTPAAMRQAASLLGTNPPPGIGLNADAAWTTMMHLLAYGGVAFLAWEYGRDRDDANLIGLTALGAVVACSIYGLVVQFAELDSVLWFAKTAYRDSVTGPFINRNSFATYVVIGLTIAQALLVSRWSRHRSRHRSTVYQRSGEWQIALFLLTVTFLAITLILTRSRGGFYSFVLALLIGGVLLVVGRVLRGRNLVLAIAGVAVAGVTVLAAGGAGLTGRLESESASVELARGAIFGPTWAAIRERPLTGYGLGSFAGVFDAVNNGELYKAGYHVDKAHNTYLELALEAGIPAALALSLCAMALVLPCVLAVIRRRSLAFGLGGAMAAAGVGAHALVDFSLQIPAVAITFFALLGAFSAQSLRSLSDKS